MRLGKAAMEALQAEISGLLTPGNELVVAGAIALYGTAQIAREKHEILREHFSEGFLREAENLRTLYGTADEINVKEAGATAFYAMGEGGFLSALWKMAEASQVGLEMDFSKVPIRQETIEICEIFDINPYTAEFGRGCSDRYSGRRSIGAGASQNGHDGCCDWTDECWK